MRNFPWKHGFWLKNNCVSLRFLKESFDPEKKNSKTLTLIVV